MVDDEAQRLGAADLLQFLELIEEHLDQDITLVAAGGTALTPLNAKPSTIDIDFTGPYDSIHAFDQAASKEPHGYEIDTWPDGTVFSLTLPDDYLARSRAVDAGLERTDLRMLHPVDLIVTKVARCDERDREDIRTTRERFDVTAEEVEQRVQEVSYVGSQENYQANLETAKRRCFSPG